MSSLERAKRVRDIYARDDLTGGKRMATIPLKDLTDLIKQAEQDAKDLRDALDFAAIPMYRCPNCQRLALLQGYVCRNCGHDPS
jgi:hypothetical protein